MRTVKTADDLHALALRHGGQAKIGGRLFNSDMEKVDAVRQPKPEPRPEPSPTVAHPVPVYPSALQLSRDDLEQILHDRDAFWMAEMRRVAEVVGQQMAAHQQPAPTRRPLDGLKFVPVYDIKSGRLESLEIKEKAQ